MVEPIRGGHYLAIYITTRLDVFGLNRPKYWDARGCRGKLSTYDVDRHYKELSEQLWAKEQGLA